MNAVNGDGVGLAWREKVGKKGQEETVIKWEKGLTLSEAKGLIEHVPIPFVLHFRIASCGGKYKELTHPFPVEREMRNSLSGTIRGQVLFHNGHWGRYQDIGIEEMVKNRVKLPPGKWSDTRVMAWLTHIHSPSFLELLNEKVILFGTEKIEIFHPDGWARVNDLLVSNRLWENHYVVKDWRKVNGKEDVSDAEWEGATYWPGNGQPVKKICRHGNCNKDVAGDSFYCVDHMPPCRWANCSKPRLVGSEHCLEHQPSCTYNLCVEPRVIGEVLCIKHLKLKAAAATAEVKELGGASIPVPFRPVPKLVSEGPSDSGGVRSAEGTVDGVVEGEKAGGSDEAPLASRPRVLDDPIAQEASTWARSLNPKAISTPHTVRERILRIMGGHSGAAVSGTPEL